MRMATALAHECAPGAPSAEPTWPPRNAAMLGACLAGEWQLTKSMTYARGGVTSTFDGRATFEPMRHGARELLAYEEVGQLLVSGNPPLCCHKRLGWDCTADPVSVFFDESHDREPGAIIAGLRHFHTIDLRTAPVDQAADQPAVCFEHPCEPDMYYGELRFGAQGTFSLRWRVQGPRKDGVIENHFNRLEGGSPHADAKGKARARC